jgi:hypothetical protein
MYIGTNATNVSHHRLPQLAADDHEHRRAHQGEQATAAEQSLHG